MWDPGFPTGGGPVMQAVPLYWEAQPESRDRQRVAAYGPFLPFHSPPPHSSPSPFASHFHVNGAGQVES